MKQDKKKEAEDTGLYYGIHTVQELLQRPEAIEEIFVVEGPKGRLVHLAKVGRSNGVIVRYRPKSFFEKQLPGKPHQCVAVRMKTFGYASLEALIEAPTQESLLLFLVGVQDPGNLGALIRSAKAFGARGVVITAREGCSVTPAAIKASAGAAATIPVAQVTQIHQAILAMKEVGWWLLGLSAEGETIDSFDLQRPTVFVLGAEGKGLKPSVQKHCDVTLGIPMAPGWDSLNVSVSGGIAMYEWRRQQPFVQDLTEPSGL